MGAITEIFRTFGPEYLARYPDMPPAAQKDHRGHHQLPFGIIRRCRLSVRQLR